MKQINEHRLHEIIDNILRESYYSDFLGSAPEQHRQRIAASRNNLREKLVNAVMQVLETECEGVEMRRTTLGMLLDPIVAKVYRYYKG